MIRVLAPILTLASCAAPADSRAEVLLFITTDCPIANAFAPEIGRIVSEYGPRGVRFTLVYTDATLTPEACRTHAAEYGHGAPWVLDARQERVRRHGVTITPEAVVLGSGGARVYRGRIDDRYLAPGRYRLQPTTRELRDAIEAVLEGRPVAVAETPAAGCPITTP